MDCVAINRSDGWVLLTKNHYYYGGDLSVSLKEKMNMETANDEDFILVSFNSAGGWVLKYKKNGRNRNWFVNPTSEQRKAFID